MQRPVGRAPDYTRPALVTAALNLTFALWVLWAIWGFVPTFVVALGLNHLISRIADRRA